MSARHLITALLCAGATACAGPSKGEGDWTLLLDATHTEGWSSTPFGGEGEIHTEGEHLVFEMGTPMTGMHWTGGALPTSDYELEVTAARLMGTDFFCGLTFPVAESHATLILGGWGGSLTGLSCIDGNDASTNETTNFLAYELGRKYTARVRVTPTHITTWVDGERLHEVALEGKRIELRTEVLPSRPLGYAAFQTRAGLSSLKLRRL
jgi:hypothetical protein